MDTHGYHEFDQEGDLGEGYIPMQTMNYGHHDDDLENLITPSDQDDQEAELHASEHTPGSTSPSSTYPDNSNSHRQPQGSFAPIRPQPGNHKERNSIFHEEMELEDRNGEDQQRPAQANPYQTPAQPQDGLIRRMLEGIRDLLTSPRASRWAASFWEWLQSDTCMKWSAVIVICACFIAFVYFASRNEPPKPYEPFDPYR